MVNDLKIDNNNGHDAAAYDEEFILRAVAIAQARSWSNPAIAASLCIPAELLDKWIIEYSDRIAVRYLEDKRIKRKQSGLSHLINPPKKTDEEKMERCPGCGADVVFEPVKAFEIQREEGFDIGTKSDIMNSGNDGIYGSKIPYVRITTEHISRCPACSLYTIQNVTEKLSNSEA